MPQCCDTENNNRHHRKYRCPGNGVEYTRVSSKTIRLHINYPWEWQSLEKEYYFCEDPECNVVYFGDDDSVILTSDMRTTIGIKENKPESIICYCFGITKADLKVKPIKEFIIENTKKNNCSCEALNPSGRCCLKYF